MVQTPVDRADAPKRMSDASVKSKTGNDWNSWFTILDEAGAKSWTHLQIATYLRNDHAVPSWWQQMVAVTYEQDRGLRAPNQQSRGLTVSRSKTISAPAMTLFDLILSDQKRTLWCNVPITIRTNKPYRSVRGRGEDNSLVEFSVLTKDFARTQVVVQHSGLADAGQVTAMQQQWSDALQRLDARASN